MKHLKRFNERISIYNPEWEKMLPEVITIFKGQHHGIDKWTYNKGNIMLNADMLQITYGINEWMAPDTLEIDIYFVKDDATEPHTDLTKVIKSGSIDFDRSPGKSIPNLRLTVDITFGDEMACEFTIDKSGIKLIQDTTYGSKFDPSNTLFAIEDNDLKKLISFLNRFNHGVNISLEDLHFLRNK